MLACHRIAAVIHQDHVIEKGVEPVALQSLVMIDQRPTPAQLFDENAIAQALRCPQLGLACGQFHFELRLGHLPRPACT